VMMIVIVVVVVTGFYAYLYHLSVFCILYI
jgi:hypothetical protein